MPTKRIDDVRATVKDLYQTKVAQRADWADWLYINHVIVVAKEAVVLAEKYTANAELAEASALLHDIADASTKRNDPEHEKKSLDTARNILTSCGYSADEIQLIVDDALRFHSCHDSEKPSSLEGKILSTADAFAHLKTDFYLYATWAFGTQKSFEDSKQWVLGKIERDFHAKIFFDDERAAWKHDYVLLKELFSR
ncbi:MAG: HD domain-containing protein [Candidatus Saccharimonadales bacterium]